MKLQSVAPFEVDVNCAWKEAQNSLKLCTGMHTFELYLSLYPSVYRIEREVSCKSLGVAFSPGLARSILLA